MIWVWVLTPVIVMKSCHSRGAANVVQEPLAERPFLWFRFRNNVFCVTWLHVYRKVWIQQKHAEDLIKAMLTLTSSIFVSDSLCAFVTSSPHCLMSVCFGQEVVNYSTCRGLTTNPGITLQVSTSKQREDTRHNDLYIRQVYFCTQETDIFVRWSRQAGTPQCREGVRLYMSSVLV